MADECPTCGQAVEKEVRGEGLNTVVVLHPAAEAEVERLREATTELAAAIRADEHGFGLRVAHALGDVDRALATDATKEA